MTLLALRRQLLRALWEWRLAMAKRNRYAVQAKLCEVVAIRRTIVRMGENERHSRAETESVVDHMDRGRYWR